VVEAWFSQWFGTDYYDLLYRHRDEAEAHRFLDELLRRYPLQKGSRIADVACGEGRHARYLAELGFFVEGFDLSAEKIARAQARAASDRVRFFQHDMRLPFARERYHLLLNLFTSFGYFAHQEENLVSLLNFEQAVRRGGRVLIDFFNSRRVVSNLVPSEEVEEEGITFQIERAFESPFLVKRIQVRDNGREHFFKEQVQALTLGDFEAMLRQTAFQIESLYGDYHFEPYREESSPRLILVLRKP
jgi:SAM-dependent methyltransferase